MQRVSRFWNWMRHLHAEARHNCGKDARIKKRHAVGDCRHKWLWWWLQLWLSAEHAKTKRISYWRYHWSRYWSHWSHWVVLGQQVHRLRYVDAAHL